MEFIISEMDEANVNLRSQPFNAFLAGFSATVGQFVLTASLRIQCNPQNKGEFGTVSHERYVSPLPPFSIRLLF